MNAEVLIPRVRRAIDGPTASSSAAASATLDDNQIVQAIADAIADVIFYTGGAWGHTLTGSGTDSYGSPTEWEVTPDLDHAEQTVVVAQAALNHFFHEFREKKIQESMSDEGRSWTYQLSANLLNQQFEMLRQARDAALAQISQANPVVERYESFIAVRDAAVSAIIEPYVVGYVGAGQERDWRFS